MSMMQILNKTTVRRLQFSLLLLLSILSLASMADEDEHNDELITMSPAVARASGIETITASSGTLYNITTLYGRISPDPASLSHIRARFDGVIWDVAVNIGHKVKRGDVLATVESNESLKRYPITSPFTGDIIARHANAGELSNGQILFSIANYDRVWAQLSVFPQQLAAVEAGQALQLSHAEFSQNSAISYMMPSHDGTPHSLAYALIDNSSARWPVGTMVKARVNTSTKRVDMLVPHTAVQDYQGKSVVFVQQGDEYHPRVITLGESDSDNIEVLEGLEQGEELVTTNSYLLKADLQKSEAAHAH